MKELLHTMKLLEHYDLVKDISLSCDVSPYGVGAVLSHVMEDRSENPIAWPLFLK